MDISNAPQSFIQATVGNTFSCAFSQQTLVHCSYMQPWRHQKKHHSIQALLEAGTETVVIATLSARSA
jgi:hypothetical protein